MKYALLLLWVGGLLVFAMDVDPDQDQIGYRQRQPTCRKLCRTVTEPDGTVIEFYQSGKKQVCEIGTNDSCTLQICDANCRGYQ